MFARFAVKPRSCSELEMNVNRFVLIYKQNALMIKPGIYAEYMVYYFVYDYTHTHTHTQSSIFYTD